LALIALVGASGSDKSTFERRHSSRRKCCHVVEFSLSDDKGISSEAYSFHRSTREFP
jgi:predicted kinase